MKMKGKLSLSQWLYVVGAAILFILATVSMVSFIKAVSSKEVVNEAPKKAMADSLQVEQLRLEITNLSAKVDSLMELSKKEPTVKYKYLKPRKDSCVIELNVNKLGNEEKIYSKEQ